MLTAATGTHTGSVYGRCLPPTPKRHIFKSPARLTKKVGQRRVNRRGFIVLHPVRGLREKD